QENLDFYAKALGQRFVKKTVNFDDPGTYHLYYGDEAGAPGTIMTFFPWAGVPKGSVGAGQVSITHYAVPPGSLAFWRQRLPAHGATLIAEETVFGEARAVFEDPHGLVLALVEAEDTRTPWLADGIGPDEAVRGFHGVTLALHEAGPTAKLLEDVFEYQEVAKAPLGTGERIRYRASHGTHAGIVDLHVDPSLPAGRDGAGTVHHVAFSVADRAAQAEVQARLRAAGQQVTQQIDRDYFWAIYTRTPGGILFEVATAEPGFAVDEPLESLGTALKLPSQHEAKRARIEAVLPVLEV
ncbi:MAG: ring-cleaving dioxygenase, partial [Pseudomonadota bacterium]